MRQLHPSRPGEQAIARYQRLLDRVYADSRAWLRDAPTWQSGLYASVRGCYTEMRSHPAELEMHFVTTTRDARVQRVRTAHRDRLLALLFDVRDDVPEPVQAELALTMIHATMCAHVAGREVPPELDEAEQTFAELLFNVVPKGR